MQKSETIIVIPARSGSKRIKNKNLVLVNDIPLIDYTIQHALNSSFSSEVYISTDSELMIKHLKKFKVNIVKRPQNISGDTASSELALINVLDFRKKSKKKDPINIIFLQCTSPFRDNSDIDNAYQKFATEGYDSLLSVVKSKKFIWKSSNQVFKPINYQYKKRPREQDFDNIYEENGSIYITKVKNLRKNKNRLSGRIGFYEMDYFSSVQIDEPHDLKIISTILPKNKRLDLKKIKIIISDFDGIFTDNNLYLNESGSESVKLSRSDGMAVEMLKKKKMKLVVISSEKNKVVKQRCKKLGIECFYGVSNKLDLLRNYLKKKNLNMSEVMYIGNDINDYDCMKNSGVSVTVNDGVEKIKQISDYILKNNGGNGAIRELVELIIGDYNE